MSRWEMPCAEYDNAAAIRLVDNMPEWAEKPPKVHIAANLRTDSDAWEFITAAYDVTDGCRDGFLHGDLRATPPAAEGDAGVGS